MVTKAKRMVVVGLAALLLAGSGTVARDGDATALTRGAPAQSRGDGDVAPGQERPGADLPSERADGPSAQAGQSGNINSGGEF